MNTSPHTIDTLNFRFTIDHNALDPFKVNMYNEISSYLLPVIEGVFELPYFSDYDIKIDTLTIDLGSLNVADGSIKCCAERLQQILEDELKKRMQNSYNGNCSVVSRKKNDEKIFLNYLLSGCFHKRYTGDPDFLLEEIFRNDISGLLLFLINNSFNSNVIRRIIWQLRIESIEKIIISLNPSEHEFVMEFVENLKVKKQVYVNGEQRSIISGDGVLHHRQILEFTLKYCLSERQVQFNRVDFIHTILLDIANHYNIGIGEYIDTIMNSLQSTLIDSAFKIELLHLLRDVKCRYKETENASVFTPASAQSTTYHDLNSKNSAKRHKNRFSEYSLQFYHLINSGSSRKLCTELWDLMMRESKHDTIDFLFRYCTSRRIISHFVELIDAEKINECITILAQDNFEFIHTIVTTTDAFIKSATVKKQPLILEVSRHKQYIYEFIIEYLIRQRNGVFSEEIFTQTILVDIANHHNITYTSLIVTMLEFFINEACYSDYRGYTKMISILQLLFKKNCKKNIPLRLTINQKISRQIDMVDIYQQCMDYLFDNTDEYNFKKYTDVETFKKDLKILYRYRPDLIYTLFQTIKNEPDCVRKIRSNCGVFTCSILFLLFIEIIIDRYSHIQWLHSRDVTYSKIQNWFTAFFTEYTYDDILRSILSIDFSNILNEDQFFIKVEGYIICQLRENYRKLSIEKNNGEKKGGESDGGMILTEHTFIHYFYYFVEHPGYHEYNGIKKGYVLDYMLRNHKDKLINEILKIVFIRPELKNVVSQSDFLFDHRIKYCLSESALFTQLAKRYFNNLLNLIDDCTINSVNTALLDFMYNEEEKKHHSNINIIYENYEVRIKSLFSALHISTSLSNKQIDDYRKIITSLISQSPNRLRMWLKSSCSNNCVIDNLSKILTEQLFLQLLLLMGNHTTMVIYHYYIYVSQAIYKIFSCNNCEQKIVALQKVIMELVFKFEVQLLNDDEIREKTGNEYVNVFSDHDDKLMIKKITEQGNISYHCTVNNHTVVNNLVQSTAVPSVLIKEKINDEPIFNPKDESSIRGFIIEDLEKEEILVTNAGIVIGAAYFERLFVMLKLTDNKMFISDHAIQKAIKILHHFATNRSICSEYEVSLNKIICGVPLDFLLDPTIELTESEKETTDSLVDAIITNWPVMKNTRRNSFRESFLNRRGYISSNNDVWNLTVEKRAFDMLIDSIPWGYSMIKFPWMSRMMKVEWENKE